MKTKILDSIILAVGSLLLGLWNLGASDLLNDEAKSALNIPYPHPPLVRFPMSMLSNWFDGAEWAVRLPLVVLGVGSVVFAYLLLREITERRILAVLGAVVIALVPAHLAWMRTGFLSTATECAWFMSLYGFARMEKNPRQSGPYWLVVLGITLGLWSNLQTMLLYPAYLFFLWRHSSPIFSSVSKFVSGVVGLVILPAALCVYMTINTEVGWDVERFITEPPSTRGGEALFSWLWGTTYGYLTLFSIAAVIAYVIARKRNAIPSQPVIVASAITAIVLVLFGFFSSARYYAPYFVPIGIFIAVYLITTLPKQWALYTLIGGVVVLGSMLPWTLRHPEHVTFYHEHLAEINTLLAEQTLVPIIGLYGYEARHYFTKLIVQVIAVKDIDQRVRVLVVNAPSLTDTEKEQLAKYFFVLRSWGTVTVYESIPGSVKNEDLANLMVGDMPVGEE